MVDTRRTAAPIIAALFAVAGTCFYSSASIAASPDACGILTQAEMSALLGVAVAPGERIMPTETRFCTWHEEGNGQRRNAKISFVSQQQYDAGKTPFPSVVTTTEAGIGDEAYFSKPKGMVNSLSVKKGSNFFRVAVRTNAEAFGKANDAAIDAKDKDVDRAIARAVLKKL